MSDILCDHYEAAPGVWVCRVCSHVAKTNAKPGRRTCGQDNTPKVVAKKTKAVNRPQSTVADGRTREAEYRRTASPCVNRGAVIATEQPCQLCGAKGELYDIYECKLHGRCSLGKRANGLQSCLTCPDINAPKRRQRVAFLSPSMYPGGAERWMISLARWLPQVGIDVTGAVITSPHLYHQSMAAEMSRWCPVVQASDSRRDLILSQADIVLVWGIGDLTPWLADYNATVVWVAHGSSEWTANLIDDAAPRVNAWVGVSDKVRESFPASIAPQMAVLHNGADIERCTPMRGRAATRAAWGIADDQVAIGYLGRLSPEKRPLAAVEALAHLPDNYVAVLCGNGMPNHVERYTAEANAMAPGRVILPGYQQHIGDALAAIDVWLNASPAEGFSISLIEAWLAGVPCVSTPTGSLPELTRDHGPLVTDVPINANGKQLAEGVLSAGRIDRARELAWDRFTASAMTARWADYLATFK